MTVWPDAQTSAHPHTSASDAGHGATPAGSATPSGFHAKTMLHRTPIHSQPHTQASLTQTAATPTGCSTPMFDAEQVAICIISADS